MVKHFKFLFLSSIPPVSEEGQTLKEEEGMIPGNLDESLSFLGQKSDFRIVGFSNGLLLRGINPEQNGDNCAWYEQNTNYIICNPVTRQVRHLPKTNKPSLYTPPVFICRGGNATSSSSSSLDEVHYEVVRVRLTNIRLFTKTVEIETFSSLTHTWVEDTRVSDLPFLLTHDTRTAFVIDDVLFWGATSGGPSGYKYHNRALLAYDRRATGLQCAKVIEAPTGQDGQGGKGSGYFGGHFGPSEGKVQFGKYDDVNFEVWVLEDYRSSTNWFMKYRVSNEIIGVQAFGRFQV
ncbi:hypothetical protein ACH5RR_028528 [Cinchona calisaya]|uniref:F-box associated domain-containing protein n=1 Tax=Cinchona calisaya TaxID=153742 RepID=A0ABD2YP20_9GENT